MRTHPPLTLLIGILALCLPALILACGGEGPTDPTPAAESRPTEAVGASDGRGGGGGGATTTEAPGVTGETSATATVGVVEDVGGQITKTEFASVSAGANYTCGVRADGSVACWGDDSWGKATPPEGEFVSVNAGSHNSCGVRVDGSVACWGFNYGGRATPTEGEFASVDVGGGHTCSVRADGSVACWGKISSGQATPLEGEFASVSAGGSHTCGVRVDGLCRLLGAQ